MLEGQLLGSSSAGITTTSSFDTFSKAVAQGAGMVTITTANLAQLSSLNLSPDAMARITDAVLDGQTVVVPDGIGATPGDAEIAWLQFDPSSGNAIFVRADGQHGAAEEMLADFALDNVETGELITQENAQAYEMGLIGARIVAQIQLGVILAAVPDTRAFFAQNALAIKALAAELARALLIGGVPLSGPFGLSYQAGVNEGLALFVQQDPPGAGQLVNTATTQAPEALAITANSATIVPGAIAGSERSFGVTVAGSLSVSWDSNSENVLELLALVSNTGIIANSSGQVIGSGTVGLSASGPVPAMFSGNYHYSVNGTGTLSIYGPAETSLGVSQ